VILSVVDRRDVAPLRTGCCVDGAELPPLLAEVVAGLGEPDWPANLVLAADGEVAELNHTYRGREGVTDVLSFSYLQNAGEGKPDLGAGQRGACHDLWVDQAGDVVGEIVLAPGFVTERCVREGWQVEAEFALLVIHGCLHLLGWDHEDPAMGKDMRNRESGLLAGMGLRHPLA